MIKSPCIGRCWHDRETKVCVGCKRTTQEIKDWVLCTDAEKLKILDNIKRRV